MSGALDTAKLKAMAIALWKLGGMDTLIKVAPRGMAPNPAYMAGYCTTFKYVVGRTPLEMEQIVGLARGSKLAGGADIFVVDPIPNPSQFELRGYSQCPAGVPTNAPGYTPHPGYPPGQGAPQWELMGYPQSGLKLLASVLPNQRLTYQASLLPAHP